MSHLASADIDRTTTQDQRACFDAVSASVATAVGMPQGSMANVAVPHNPVLNRHKEYDFCFYGLVTEWQGPLGTNLAASVTINMASRAVSIVLLSIQS